MSNWTDLFTIESVLNLFFFFFGMALGLGLMFERNLRRSQKLVRLITDLEWITNHPCSVDCISAQYAKKRLEEILNEIGENP